MRFDSYEQRNARETQNLNYWFVKAFCSTTSSQFSMTMISNKCWYVLNDESLLIQIVVFSLHELLIDWHSSIANLCALETFNLISTINTTSIFSRMSLAQTLSIAFWFELFSSYKRMLSRMWSTVSIYLSSLRRHSLSCWQVKHEEIESWKSFAIVE